MSAVACWEQGTKNLGFRSGKVDGRGIDGTRIKVPSDDVWGVCRRHGFGGELGRGGFWRWRLDSKSIDGVGIDVMAARAY